MVCDSVDHNLASPLPATVLNDIKDHGNFFSAAGVAKTLPELKSISRDFRKDATIETFARVPPGKLRQVEAMSPEARGKFLEAWAQDRAAVARSEGIFILICKHP